MQGKLTKISEEVLDKHIAAHQRMIDQLHCCRYSSRLGQVSTAKMHLADYATEMTVLMQVPLNKLVDEMNAQAEVDQLQTSKCRQFNPTTTTPALL